MLTLKIKEQNIFVSNPRQYVKGTVGAKCTVVFDSYWKDYNRTVVFKPSAKFRGGPITVYVPDMTAEITIPWEVMDQVGSFKIGAYGTTDELTTPTLWCEPIAVVDGTDTIGKAPQEPSPSVYNQLINIANEAVLVAQSVRDDADSGKFDGEKGDKGDKGDAGAIKFIVVAELPEVGDESVIYLLSTPDGQEKNLYDEYIYTNNAWEKIGSASVEVDLTDYVKNTDYATQDKAGVVRILGSFGVAIMTGDTWNGCLAVRKASNPDIRDKKDDYKPIVPANLDYAVKTSLTTNTETLTDEEKAAAQTWLGITDLVGDIETLLGGI